MPVDDQPLFGGQRPARNGEVLHFVRRQKGAGHLTLDEGAGARTSAIFAGFSGSRNSPPMLDFSMSASSSESSAIPGVVPGLQRFGVRARNGQRA